MTAMFITIAGTIISQPSFKNGIIAFASDPTSKSSYETTKGWPDWSQYGGSMLKKWGSNNYGCVTTSRIRGAARHGGTKIPSQVDETAPLATSDYKVLSGGVGGQNDKFSSSDNDERIKEVIKIAKQEWKKNHEVMVRVGNGSGAYADSDGGSHTMMVSDIKGDKLYVMDPAVGYGGNWSSSFEAKQKIVRYEIDGGYRNNKQDGFSSSAVRAQMGSGVMSSSGTAASETSDTGSGSSNAKDSVEIHPIFNPFQTPQRATDDAIKGDANTGAVGDGSVSTEEVDAYNNIQKMSAMSSFVQQASQWMNYITVVMLVLLSAYMLVGGLLFALDESALGNLRLSDAASRAPGLLGKIVNPGGYFMGIKPTDSRGMIMSVGHIFLRQLVIVILLGLAATGFATWMFGQFFRLIYTLLGGGTA